MMKHKVWDNETNRCDELLSAEFAAHKPKIQFQPNQHSIKMSEWNRNETQEISSAKT